MDTGDTGDTGASFIETGEPEGEQEIISAAKLAGETGGISCMTANLFNPLILILSLMLIVSRRRA